MNNKFTYYDVVAIYIPGLLFSILASIILFCDKSASAKDVLNIGFAFTLSIMIVAYAIGEVIHSLSKVFEYLFWKLFKGWPALWIADDAYASLRKIAIPYFHLISDEDRELIKDEMDNEKKRKTRNNREEGGNENDSSEAKKIFRKDIESCFFSMKRKACAVDGIEQNLNVMRSMAGFHSSMIIVSLLMVFIIPLGLDTGDKALFEPSDCVFFRMLALGVALICLLRFCYFSVTYVRYLYVGYVAYIQEHNKYGSGDNSQREESDEAESGELPVSKGENGTVQTSE